MTIYPTLGDEGIAFAMKECDAVAVFTSRGLLPNVLKSIRECPEIKTIIYFSEMHALEENCALVSDELKEQFATDGRTLYSFDTLLELGGSTDQQSISFTINIGNWQYWFFKLFLYYSFG